MIQLSKVTAERNAVKRADHILQVGQETRERLVFVDETSVNLKVYVSSEWLGSQGSTGDDFKSLCTWKKVQFLSRNILCMSLLVHHFRYSVLPALTLDGIIFSSIVEGSFNGESFMDFLEGLLDNMNLYPQTHSVLVMDNCAIHHVEDVQAMCDEKYGSSARVSPF